MRIGLKGPRRQKSNILNSHYKGLKKKREKEAEHLFEEIVAENFPNLRKERSMSRKHKEPQTR